MRLFETAGYAFPISVLRDRVVVLGLGNILLSDEGAGVHAVTALRKRYTFSPPIDLIDGGTMGLDLLPIFQDRDRILIIDAVDFGKNPGHVGIIEGDAIATVLNTKLSVHHIGLADLLVATKLTRDLPPEIYLVGIQPHSLDVGLSITEPLSYKLVEVLDAALWKLREWNITCTPL